MPFNIKQMPDSTDKEVDESDKVNASLGRFKIWFVGIVLVCFAVIAGAAVFYYLLNDLGYKI